MSNTQNSQSSILFPTETIDNTLFNEKSLLLRQESKIFSSLLFKTKYGSKQKIIQPELESIVNKIQMFVDDVDNKIQNRVQLVKQVYLNEYKQQVAEMSTQLKNLRQKLDSQILRERANEKMFYLQEERDFFRHQVIKLNQQMNRLNEQNKHLKKQIQEQKGQSSNYKQIVYNLQSKLLRIKNSSIKRQKLLQAQSNSSQAFKDKTSSTRVDQQNSVAPKSERKLHEPLYSLQQISNQQQRQINRTDSKLRPSKSMRSYTKFETAGREMMRTTAPVTYPKLAVQRLQKIQGYSQLLERQQIVEACINQLKKQIYYRNLSIGQKDARIHFDQTKQVNFEVFTKTDKKQLVVKILSNQKVLNQFYQFLFNNKTKQLESRMVENKIMGGVMELVTNKLEMNASANKFSTSKFKLTDAKFNTKMLTNLKTEFNRKIYDIKHNK